MQKSGQRIRTTAGIRSNGWLRWSCTGLLVAGLAACSGGGGGGGNAAADNGTGNGGGSTTPRALTAANARQELSAAYSSTETISSQVKSISSDISGRSTDTAATPAPARFSAVDFARTQLERALASRRNTSGPTAKAVRTNTLACQQGGSILVTLNDADNDGDLSTGDSFSYQFNNCRASGQTTNGSLRFSNLVIPQTDTGTMTMTITFVALSSSIDGQATVLDGGFDMRVTIADQAATVVSVTASGQSLRAKTPTHTEIMTNFSTSAELNQTASTYKQSSNATFSYAESNKSYTLTTSTPFTGTLGANPSAGSMTIKASDGSQARMTVASPTTVRIEADSDGDNVFEHSETRTWREFKES